MNRTPRLEDAFPVTVDAQGRKLCRWDQAVIPKGRRTFCGKRNCIHQVSLRTNPNYLRRHVFKRDQGICAECGCDTNKIRNVASAAARAYHELGSALGHREPYYEWAYRATWNLFVSIGFNWGIDAAEWEADHIVEVVRGGDSALENMQTLCIPCHKAKTKRLAGEMARERRDGQRGLIQLCQP